MIAALARSPRTLAAIAAVTWKEWAAFRSHMMVSLLTGPLRVFLLWQIWRVTVPDLELRAQLVEYTAAALLVVYATWDFADWNLQMLVRLGKFQGHLLQPLEHPFYALSQKVGHRCLAVVFEILPVWAILSVLVGRPLLPRNPAAFAASVAIAFFLQFAINYAVGLLGFWMVRAEGVRRCLVLLRDVMAGAWFPLILFPEAAREMLLWLPFAWAIHVPAQVFLGAPLLPGMTYSVTVVLALQAAMCLAAWGAMWGVRRIAVRRHMAVGG